MKPDSSSQNLDWFSWAPGFLLRFICLATVLSGLAYVAGASLIEAALPVIQAEIEWLDPVYAIDDIRLDHEGADRVVRIRVHQAQCIVLDGQAFCGDPRGWANASTMIGSSFLSAVLLASVTLAWPRLGNGSRWQEMLWRLVWLVPATAMLWMADLPILLWGSIWNLHHASLAPDSISPLLIWVEFLQGGGRLILVCAAAVAVLVGMSCDGSKV